MLAGLENVGASGLDDAEKEAIRFAEKVAVAHGEIGRADVDALRQHWTPEQIVELGCVAGMFCSLNRFSIAFGLTPTQPGEGGPEDREGVRSD